MSAKGRFELEKTYTSYAITLTSEQYDAIGYGGRLAIKGKLRAFDLDLIEFDRHGDEVYIYLRIAAEDDTPERHAAIKDILEAHLPEAQDLPASGPGPR